MHKVEAEQMYSAMLHAEAMGEGRVKGRRSYGSKSR